MNLSVWCCHGASVSCHTRPFVLTSRNILHMNKFVATVLFKLEVTCNVSPVATEFI